MKLKPLRRVPCAVSGGLIIGVCLLQLLPRWWPAANAFQRLEWMTYDWRVRQAFSGGSSEPTHLSAVFIDDDSLKLFNAPPFSFQYPWPRHLYGRVVKNLTSLGVKGIGFDILFRELDLPNPRTDVRLPDGQVVASDRYFAQQLRAASNVVLAVFGETIGNRWQAVAPAVTFHTNAASLGHTVSDTDSDGVLRRAQAFKEDARLGRIWHMGIVLAALHLGLDLNNAVIEPGRIILRGADGGQRILPVDRQGFFYIDWSLAWNDRRLMPTEFEAIAGFQAISTDPGAWRNKLVVVGSIGSGNNISDVGATPISNSTYLLSKHWNVAHSIITGRFVRTTPTVVECLLIVFLGVLSALLTWNLRAPWPSMAVVVAAVAYCSLALWLFLQFRFWLPIVLPVGGALLVNHGSLIAFQLLFEQKEQRRVKNMFSRLVSPTIVQELLKAEKLDLAGSRREVTILFADVRGFTELTDTAQAAAEAYVRQHQLNPEAAEGHFSAQAQMTLESVNAYLSVVAEQVKNHEGTFDKYIGDCVMAFWGAPTTNDRHALLCVRAAIDAQRAIDQLNQQRSRENQRRERDNQARAAAGRPPGPLLPLLTLGTGINSGFAIVGLMGSDAHQVNYTVFGREVNVASRLERVSGSNRIVISQATYLNLKRDDPVLAATCIEMEPVTVKGIRTPVQIYEVPWRLEGMRPAESQLSPTPEAS